MIDNILGNKTNILILRFLFRFENQFFPIEEIAKETGSGLRNCYDSLKLLIYEEIVSTKTVSNKVHYRVIADSKVSTILSSLFQEEKTRFFFKTHHIYKILSELELKIVKFAGSNVSDIILFGSIAKGRDTPNSDIDLCVILKKKEDSIINKIRSLQYENKFKHEIQIQIFSSSEFVQASNEGNPLVDSILRDGLFLNLGK